jgi:hypothetical protein
MQRMYLQRLVWLPIPGLCSGITRQASPRYSADVPKLSFTTQAHGLREPIGRLTLRWQKERLMLHTSVSMSLHSEELAQCWYRARNVVRSPMSPHQLSCFWGYTGTYHMLEFYRRPDISCGCECSIVLRPSGAQCATGGN